jgi:4-diphosphocytidyl-2-C-methyl-D-erythritol kinase
MRIKCNAKINLGLSITEKREDGFHNLESIFLPVPWYDIIEIQESGKTSFSSSGIAIDGDEKNNLCMKAYHLLARDFILPPVSIHLEKNIPIGAGLGGGSSDGAHVLKGLNELFRLNLSIERLEQLASLLGSDCPFFVQNKAAFVTGRGELLDTSLSIDLNCHCLLVNPGIHISTKEAYGAITPQKAPFNLLEINKLNDKDWQTTVVNDFETALLHNYPKLAALKHDLLALNPFYVSMSGSGSSFFAFFKEKPNEGIFKDYASKVFELNINQ